MNYVPGLDGLRAVAVIVVVLFHAEFDAVAGGFLGVSLFFTLSGFLITTLLLAEYDEAGTVSLRRFYARRARRLLPAAYVCLALVVAASAWWTAGQQRGLPGDVLASVANVANWRFAFSPASYEDIFLGEPSPVAHFWSLAIEEQIYLVLPIVVYVALRRGRRTLAFTTAALLAASVSATLLTSDPDLVYNGTHTRAAELLVGVALAQALRHRALSPTTAGAARAVLPGALASGAFVALVATASLGQSWIYDGGLLGVALLSAVLIAAVVDGRFPAMLLATRPLVAVGKVSYGIYLFHWPVFLLLDQQRTGLDRIPLFVLQCSVTAALTLVSYALIEQPVRRGGLISRDRAMVPALALSAAAVAVVAVLAVPAPSLSETEQLLALGEQDVIDFTAIAPDVGEVIGNSVPPESTDGGPLDESPTREAPERDENAFAADIAIAASEAVTPPRVVVLGSDAAVVQALVDSDRTDEFDVVDGVQVGCPLSSVGVVGCAPLVDHWKAVGGAVPADVVVIATSDAEVADSFARKLASQTDQELRQLGADDDAAVAATLATIDAVLATGAEVVWYTPVDSSIATFWNFSRIAVERPAIRTVVGSPPDTLVDTVRDLAASRRTVASAGTGAVGTSLDPALRLLVIGDSTSLNLSWALHDGSDGLIEVLWAGSNGCPFAAVDATRGVSEGTWTDPMCTPWSAKVTPLLESFRPDALLVMSGPTELQEHMLAGASTGSVATDPAFAAGREQQLEALLAAVGPTLPVLVADLPTIAEGRFSGGDMISPERLGAVNGQIVEWDERFDQVKRFPYRDTLEMAEALRPPDDPIRSDGAHPDIGPLTELARTVYVDELLVLVDAVRVEMTPVAFGS